MITLLDYMKEYRELLERIEKRIKFLESQDLITAEIRIDELKALLKKEDKNV